MNKSELWLNDEQIVYLLQLPVGTKVTNVRFENGDVVFEVEGPRISEYDSLKTAHLTRYDHWVANWGLSRPEDEEILKRLENEK